MAPDANSASKEKIVVTLTRGNLYSACGKSHDTVAAGQIGQITQTLVPVLFEN